MDDKRRRYYRLTEVGRRVAEEEAERLAGWWGWPRAKGFLPKAKPA